MLELVLARKVQHHGQAHKLFSERPLTWRWWCSCRHRPLILRGPAQLTCRSFLLTWLRAKNMRMHRCNEDMCHYQTNLMAINFWFL